MMDKYLESAAFSNYVSAIIVSVLAAIVAILILGFGIVMLIEYIKDVRR